jgi:predicted secreted hydrolase
MRKRIIVGLGLVVTIVLGGAGVWFAIRDGSYVQSQLVALADDAEGYRRAEGPVPLAFPETRGPHPDYQTEWWYHTGNLETAEGRRFGYQLTFFRRALAPPAERLARGSAWAADQVYMAHFALTDVAAGRHQAFERFSREAGGLAGAQASPYRIWLEDWSVEETEGGSVRMRAGQDGVVLDLVLTDTKGPILHGDSGYSQKGPDPGNASYYYSLTRLATSGTVQVAGEAFKVSGLSWMDQEFSTSGLAPGQVGWDWFSIQLDDGAELMVFQLRRDDGSQDLFSSGTFVAPDGHGRHLAQSDFEILVEETWRSQATGAVYPSRWTLSIPGEDLRLEVEPYLAEQELTLSYAYWEGAVQVEGGRAGQVVVGNGYVEMTGYAGSMRGQF